MPLCQDKEAKLKENAQKHISAQRAVLQRLDARIDQMETELNGIDPDSERAAKLKLAIADLRFHVRGEKLNDEGEFEKVQEPGLKRLELMESLYMERNPRRFTYQNAKGESRVADIYGLPTIEEMDREGNKDALKEMIVRSISLLESGESTRNPYDYLSTEKMEVKDALDRGIEHHHVFNNVVVSSDTGQVTPKSIGFRYDANEGKLKLAVIPEFHGYDYQEIEGKPKNPDQMDSVQFIALQDAIHSGDDSVTHLHYYQFDDPKTLEELRQKAKQKALEESSQAKSKIPKIETELSNLRKRFADPEQYERDLVTQQQNIQKEIDTLGFKKVSASSISKWKAKALDDASADVFTDEEKAVLSEGSKNQITREQLNILQRSKALSDAQKKQLENHLSGASKFDELDAVNKELTKHRKVGQMRQEQKDKQQEIDKIIDEIQTLANTAKVKEGTIKVWLRNLSKNLPLPDEKAAIAKQYLVHQNNLGSLLDEAEGIQKRIEKESDIASQIQQKEKSLKENQLLAELTEESANTLFDESNGFFSFDKGRTEKEAHETFRPEMNKEITKMVAREAVEYIERNNLDIEELYREQYKNNLTNRMAAFVSKLV